MKFIFFKYSLPRTIVSFRETEQKYSLKGVSTPSPGWNPMLKGRAGMLIVTFRTFVIVNYELRYHFGCSRKKASIFIHLGII